MPELPVRDVFRAQLWYHKRLGFQIGWHNHAGRIGAVTLGECILFLRQSARPGGAAWIFAEDVDAVWRDWEARGAAPDGPPRDMPWGLRQFTQADLCGNCLTVHHDLDARE
ncbi:VOC family protein [Pseudoponticoccus marisrubri]|uniref:VOC family protein n=1 Tax=Pseudoponticoccus marisrubri TaxID=1685382 RepID=UPI001F0AB861|nr:VOC family protein [Pseudoponticoccus marisrubri]